MGRPFPHKLFVYFAAHDIETQLIVPQDGPIGHIAEIGEGTRGKSHTAAGFFADGIDEGRDELIGLEDLWVLLTERRELKNVVYPVILMKHQVKVQWKRTS